MQHGLEGDSGLAGKTQETTGPATSGLRLQRSAPEWEMGCEHHGGSATLHARAGQQVPPQRNLGSMSDKNNWENNLRGRDAAPYLAFGKLPPSRYFPRYRRKAWPSLPHPSFWFGFGPLKSAGPVGFASMKKAKRFPSKRMRGSRAP